MEELAGVTENQRNDLDDLLSDEYDEESEEWMESLISSEGNDAESESDNEEESSEKKTEETQEDEGLSIDDPEEVFFEMDLTPSEKPAAKPMEVQTKKSPIKVTKHIMPCKRETLLTAKKPTANPPKSMHARFSKPKEIPQRHALKQEPEKKVKREKPKQIVKERTTIKEEKSLWKERRKGEKKPTGFLWQQTRESSKRKEDHMNSKTVKTPSMQTVMMDFRKKQESACLSDKFFRMPSQIGLTVNENRRKKTDLMEL